MKIDLNKVARKIEVNNHISLVTTTASPIIFSVRPAYIEKRRIYSSLISENVPLHQDYQASLSQARLGSRKRLQYVINELESLKPEFDRQVDELNREDDELHRVGNPCSRPDVKKTTSQPSSTYNNSLTSSSNRTPIDQQFQKLSSDFLPPNQATLSRHSFLGPNGLKSQWVAPSRIKVQYPSKYRLGFY
ncbi:BnaA01g17670D [Brassica napus]|uniref:BnaA01g17670D protein n=1 Tax=Brassica napus TaxID=3708 RepID=A0A078H3Y1_BRANA|nr:BnaA01g17670D [Brassica napus]